MRARAHRGCAAMAGVLALRVVAGLAAAALAALLLEHYGVAGPPSPLPKPRDAQRPYPAPGSGAHNVFWGLQVMRLEAAGGKGGCWDGQLSSGGGLGRIQTGGSAPCALLLRGFVVHLFLSFPRRELAGPHLSVRLFLTQIMCMSMSNACF